MTVKLQGIYSKQEAKAVKELKTGDVIMWNYGYTSTGVTIYLFHLKSNQDGVVREKKNGCRKTGLDAIATSLSAPIFLSRTTPS